MTADTHATAHAKLQERLIEAQRKLTDAYQSAQAQYQLDCQAANEEFRAEFEKIREAQRGVVGSVMAAVATALSGQR